MMNIVGKRLIFSSSPFGLEVSEKGRGLILRGIAVLLGFYLLGSILQDVTSLPLPANVVGLVLFIVALFAGWVKVEWVEAEADWLLKHMMLFFAPIIVGVEVYFSYIRSHWLLLGVSWLASALAAMLVAGWTVKGLSRGGENPHE